MSRSWYVYAVLPASATAPGALVGLDGAPVSLVAAGSLAAAVSPIDGGTPYPSPAHMYAHEEVVEAMRENWPALPVRFGTVLPDVPAVRHALNEQRATLARDLGRLGDKVELGLVVLEDEAAGRDTQAAGSGLDAPEDLPAPLMRLRRASGEGARYLAARYGHYARAARQRRDAQQVAAQCEDAMRPYMIEARCMLRPAPRLVLRATYLTEPAQVESCRAACEGLREAMPDLRILVTGPWPPYSFVTGAEGPNRLDAATQAWGASLARAGAVAQVAAQAARPNRAEPNTGAALRASGGDSTTGR